MDRLFIVAVILWISALGPARHPIATAAETSVSIVGTFSTFAFSPQTVTINVGDSVVWRNTTSAPHTVTGNDGTWGSDPVDLIDPGEQFTHTFLSPGAFAYHCELHTGMTGTVIVEGGAPDKRVYLPLVRN